MSDNDIFHSGVKGMRWGIRRYQNEDGSLTPEGRERYGVKNDRDERKLRRKAVLLDKQMQKKESTMTRHGITITKEDTSTKMVIMPDVFMVRTMSSESKIPMKELMA